MNKVNKFGLRWLTRLLIAAITLMPIWFSPLRTSPLAFHVCAWAIIFVAGLGYYIAYRQHMPISTRNLWIMGIGMALGICVSGVAFANLITTLGDEGKLVGLYCLNAVTLWFALTHRNSDGAVEWFKKS